MHMKDGFKFRITEKYSTLPKIIFIFRKGEFHNQLSEIKLMQTT